MPLKFCYIYDQFKVDQECVLNLRMKSKNLNEYMFKLSGYIAFDEFVEATNRYRMSSDALAYKLYHLLDLQTYLHIIEIYDEKRVTKEFDRWFHQIFLEPYDLDEIRREYGFKYSYFKNFIKRLNLKRFVKFY